MLGIKIPPISFCRASMAGLQYKFFPTDFFVPSQQSVTRDGSSRQQVVPVRTRKIDEIDESKQPKAIVLISEINKKNLKALPSSSQPLVDFDNQNHGSS
ncbi:unnamed protein product [Ilex paraguariensis]|uniref:Uncharacterized protein n=1 Tax=Ilex paraguariensis TaxID=185542 RepID=A0ABC8USM5_9AQUA